MPDSKLKIIAEGIAGAATIAATIILAPLLRPWYRRWGATEAEVARELPGDDYVPAPRSQITLALTVAAPAAALWPWFVQLGCGRGGWYSYDLLDNAGQPSADRILTEHQQLAVGDVVKAMPKGDFGFPVAIIAPERALILAGTLNTATGQPVAWGAALPAAYFAGDQAFVLEPVDAGTTRLILRNRMGWNASRLNTFIYRGLVEPISFVMGRQMLRNLKRRAERGAD